MFVPSAATSSWACENELPLFALQWVVVHTHSQNACKFQAGIKLVTPLAPILSISFPVESSSSHQSYLFIVFEKPNKGILRCDPDTKMLPDLEVISQYVVFFWFLKDCSAPVSVR